MASRSLLAAVALTCLVGQAGAAAPPESPTTTVYRIFNTTPRPEPLRLNVDVHASERDEGNFFAIFSVARDGSAPRRLQSATVVDLTPHTVALCAEPACRVRFRDGGFAYSLESSVRDRRIEYLVAVRGIRPVVRFTGRGWDARRDLTVQRFGTRDGGGTRTLTPTGNAYEEFAGVAPVRAVTASFAYAALPCEQAGGGEAQLVARGGQVFPVTCERPVAAYVAGPTSWAVSGEASGLTRTYTRLLVVGVR